VKKLDQLDARALGALLMLGAYGQHFSTAGEVAAVLELGAPLGHRGGGRLWAPKLRHLVDAGVVETVPSMGVAGYRVKLPLAVKAFDRWDF
jgi:hypothetical protein